MMSKSFWHFQRDYPFNTSHKSVIAVQFLYYCKNFHIISSAIREKACIPNTCLRKYSHFKCSENFMMNMWTDCYPSKISQCDGFYVVIQRSLEGEYCSPAHQQVWGPCGELLSSPWGLDRLTWPSNSGQLGHFPFSSRKGWRVGSNPIQPFPRANQVTNICAYTQMVCISDFLLEPSLNVS